MATYLLGEIDDATVNLKIGILSIALGGSDNIIERIIRSSRIISVISVHFLKIPGSD